MAKKEQYERCHFLIHDIVVILREKKCQLMLYLIKKKIYIFTYHNMLQWIFKISIKMGKALILKGFGDKKRGGRKRE